VKLIQKEHAKVSDGKVNIYGMQTGLPGIMILSFCQADLLTVTIFQQEELQNFRQP